MLLIREWVVVVSLAAALVAPTLASADNFNAGALIIPSGASFQTDCGAVSEYGLVYDILRANQWLAANPPAPRDHDQLRVQHRQGFAESLPADRPQRAAGADDRHPLVRWL